MWRHSGTRTYPYPPMRTPHEPSSSRFLPWKAKQPSPHGTRGQKVYLIPLSVCGNLSTTILSFRPCAKTYQPLLLYIEYYSAAKPPVRCSEPQNSHSIANFQVTPLKTKTVTQHICGKLDPERLKTFCHISLI